MLFVLKINCEDFSTNILINDVTYSMCMTLVVSFYFINKAIYVKITKKQLLVI